MKARRLVERSVVDLDNLAQIAQTAFGFRPWAEASPGERARWLNVARILTIAMGHAPHGRHRSTDVMRELLARTAAEAYAIKRTIPSRTWEDKPPESRQRWQEVVAAVTEALRQTCTGRNLH